MNVDRATVFMLEKSLSSSSSLQMTFTEVKCMIRMYDVCMRQQGGGLGGKAPQMLV